MNICLFLHTDHSLFDMPILYMTDVDEDVHQCGRCKQVFNNVQDYFIHKKAKSCKKVKDPSLCIKSPLLNSNTQVTMYSLYMNNTLLNHK